MKLFYYGVIASIGVAGLAGWLFPEFRSEIIFGWLGPTIGGVGSTFMLNRAAKIDARAITKSLQIGFMVKLAYFGVYILLVFQLYAFEPFPFVCSFAGFFITIYGLEAVIIKNLTK
ncbi:MAG: hypothetical protein HOD97_04250 [Candidatus Marinimicrobia bacterium]|nr:hypothetical protein [Candidatus Neomarinimicrobiota bacterium]MBT3617931.1 hypothetical protein [Candidatus Neomarinimicrobiota bacterium]MBT3828768.1 hypothetical protein [Candidatus Neomarinimicrobiota bacterium]MBT3997059.1 hypothetical protein [Candidatus Neomarinimicrobiota bacterium]MBT4280815.1 hypothetical protein [Candidatus Neomarinimicrobiota bacterium]